MRRSSSRFAIGFVVLAALASAATVAALGAATGIDLSSGGIGSPPPDFEFRRADNRADEWTVVADPTASGGLAIERIGREPSEDRHSLAIYMPLSLKNADVSASFNLVSGAFPNAGIALRLASPDDYLLVVATSLEGRVDLFRVVDGNEERIAGVEADVMADHWQLIRVVVEDDHITVWLDHQLLFQAWDRTFLKDGRIALWAEEDSTTRFHRIEITALPYTEHD